MHDSQSQRKTVTAQTSFLPLVAIILANVALAFGPWMVRDADVGPIAAALWRMMIAAPLLLGAALMMGQRPFAQAKGFGWVLLAGGVLFAADLGTWHLGILRTTLANTTLFGNVATLILPIYGFIVARAWPNRAQALAVLLAAIGGGVMLGRSAELSADHLLGDLLSLLAGLLYAAYFILMIRVRTVMQPLPALALASFACTVPLLLAALALGENVMPDDWWPLIGLALVSQVAGQGLMIYAIGNLSPLVVGIALLTQPIVAAIIGWVVFDEKLGPLDLLGAGLVAIALVLVRKGTRPLAPGQAEEQKAANAEP